MASIREQALGAWWYWGTEAEAAEALGVSKRTFIKALQYGRLNDEETIKFKQGVVSKTASQRYTIDRGYRMIQETMSFRQADLLKSKGFKGRRFAKAVRVHERRRGKIPKGVGDFITEVGSP